MMKQANFVATSRNHEYVRAYRAWLGTLSPAQRRLAEDLDLGEADISEIKNQSQHREIHADDYKALFAVSPEKSAPFKRALAETISELCHWFVMPPGQRGLNAKAVGQRVIMAMWVMRPDIIGNLSLTEIGELVDTRPEVLSRQASAFTKRFGIRGRAQFSDKARKAQRDAALNRSNLSTESIHGKN